MRLADGFRNVAARLGVGRDKAYHGEWVAPRFDERQMAAIYRSSALARKIVDIPADDACREWRAWSATADEITAIERAEREHALQRKVRQALLSARLYGGAALLIGAQTARPEEPLDPRRVRRGDLQYLSVIPRARLLPDPVSTDPSSEYYGVPEAWSIVSTDGLTRVHASRLAVLHGTSMPEGADGAGEAYWGDPVLLSCLQALRNAAAAKQNAASLVYEAKVDVLKIKGMAMGLANTPGYEDALVERTGLIASIKGNNGMLVLDGDDDYSSKSASFSGLTDLIQQFDYDLSAAADIPATRFLGQSPKGLSATGESDIRNYYDQIRVRQTMHIEPALANLDEVLIRSALGSRPEEAHYNWRPLWQPSASEVSSIGKAIAETFSSPAMATLPPEAVGRAFVNALTEAGAAPGLEALVDEYEDGGGLD